MLSHILREFILPPGSLLVILLAGLLLRKRQPRVSAGLIALATVTLYLLSIPPVSVALCRWMEKEPALSLKALANFHAQAIVILGGGAEQDAPEYDGATVPSESTQVRIAYAAYLARATGLPLLVTGGYGNPIERSEAGSMRLALASYGLTPKWLESRSSNTAENASMSWDLVHPEGITRVLLVTDAMHSRRAKRAFEKVGFQALAAPTGFRRLGPWDRGAMQVVPTSRHFQKSSEALRAGFSLLWYFLRGT
jgi:uncharacterized SAM-binding protein YcdF (DUF218 family)